MKYGIARVLRVSGAAVSESKFGGALEVHPRDVSNIRYATAL